jgi:hypothetical protein
MHIVQGPSLKPSQGTKSTRTSPVLYMSYLVDSDRGCKLRLEKPAERVMVSMIIKMN